MTDELLLQKISRMILTNNEVLLTAMDKKINKLKIDLGKNIEASQIDTIQSLSDVINEAYRLHEERIVRIENELDLPPLKQN